MRAELTFSRTFNTGLSQLSSVYALLTMETKKNNQTQKQAQLCGALFGRSGCKGPVQGQAGEGGE